MDINKDYYAILGVHQTAEDLLIKVAYRALGKKYHPDTFTGSGEDAHKRMSQINEAYEVLSNVISREKYDELRGVQPHDSGAHFDEENSSNSQSDPLRDNWDIASKYRPELRQIDQHLNIISHGLAYTFRAFLLETKEFDAAQKIATSMESDFMRNYFGSDQQIREFANHLIKTRNKGAARELNKVVSIFGANIDVEGIIQQISDEFNIEKPVDLTKLDFSGLSVTQKELVIQHATELIRCGFSLRGSKNNWEISRGSMTTFSYSLRELTKDAQGYIKHYQS